MKLVRYGEPGRELPGMIDADLLRDLSYVYRDILPEDLDPDGIDISRSIDPGTLPLVGGEPRLGAPLAGIGRIVRVLPEDVFVGGDAPALAGPFDPVPHPGAGQPLRHDVSLGAVIGTAGRAIDEAEVFDHVAAWTVLARVIDEAGAEQFAALGPWLLTSEEVRDPRRFGARCKVNLSKRIARASHVTALEPGDIVACTASIATATAPPLDEHGLLECGIVGLGMQQHPLAV